MYEIFTNHQRNSPLRNRIDNCYAAFQSLLKVSGMLEMLIGRLEIFPILYLFRSISK